MKNKIFDGLKATPEYSIDKISEIVEGELRLREAQSQIISHLLVDSRLLLHPQRTLFFAFKTKRRDGHKYIARLFSRGVRNFVVSDLSFVPEGANAVLVDDVLKALQQLAAFHRSSFDFPIWGITGSNGKTTVKEWAYQLLKKDFVVGRNPMSYNSQIGVPLSVWGLNDSMDIGVFECGISKTNEMDALREVLKPSFGLFLNITEVHSSGFESDLEKAKEKAKLFEACQKVAYCADHEIVHQVLRELSAELCTWGESEEADLRVVDLQRDGRNHTATVQWMGERAEWSLPFYDEASVQNVFHAALLALIAGVRFDKLKARIATLRPVSMRLEQKKGRNRSLLIDDVYSNDFTSLRYALGALAIQPKKTKMLVISDFEQIAVGGEDSIQVALSMAQGLGVNQIVGVGNAWVSYVEKHKPDNCSAYYSTADLLLNLQSLNIDDAAVLIKGARRFRFERVVEAWQEQSHHTRLEVNLGSLLNNVNTLKAMVPSATKTMVMLKALSYGVGDIEVARFLELNHVDYFGVAYADEGKSLREGGVKTPIMVMNADDTAVDQIIQYQLEPVIYSIGQLERWHLALAEKQMSIRVHLNIDTGMHRLGIKPEELSEVLEFLQGSSLMLLSTVYSHLHGADDERLDEYTLAQADLFSSAVTQIRQSLPYYVDAHLLNSAGIQRFPQFSFDMVRMGIALYGVSVRPSDNPLHPVVRFISQINQIREVKAGDTVGYGERGISDHDRLIATIPVGYADGLRRTLSEGVGSLYINGNPAPIVGSVCMDMVMVDVSGMDADVGDKAVIFDDHHDLYDFAKTMDTIPYEVLTSISSRVKRVYLYD